MAVCVLFRGAAGVHRRLLLSDDSQDVERKREAVGPGQTHEAGTFEEFIWTSEAKLTVIRAIRVVYTHTHTHSYSFTFTTIFRMIVLKSHLLYSVILILDKEVFNILNPIVFL